MRTPGAAYSWTVCLTYVLFALAYNALVPIGESPDELAHVEYLRLVIDERRLPRARDDFWQGHQAPLYYAIGGLWGGAIAALAGCPIEPSGLPTRRNPGFPASPNFNYLVHGAAEQLGAWGCQEWSFHLLRLLSTALTVPMILLVVATLRLAAPDSPTTAAVGGLIPALLPSHVAISAMFNNDALVNLLIVAATYLVVLAVRTGDAAALVKAAVVAAIATTAKLSGVFLFGLILVALVARRDLGPGILRPGPVRGWLAAAGACSVLPLLVLARNVREWGDPFAVTALERNLVKLIAIGSNPVTGDPVRYYAIEMPELFANAFMVAYGAVNFRFTGAHDLGRWGPRIVLAGLGLSLVLRSGWRRIDRRALLVLAAGFALFFATYAYPGYRYRWLQVRYFFNQFPLIALVSAVGIETLWRGARRLGVPASDRVLVAVVYVCLVGLNLLVLWAGVIPHLYRFAGAAG